MKILMRLLTLSAIFLTTGLAFAQDSTVDKPKLTIKGKIYMQAAMKDLDDDEDDTKENSVNYELTRVYVTLKSKLNETFTARVTTDVADSGGKYTPYIKYAYIQAQPKVGDAKLDIRGGMIATPIADLVYKHSDYRWVYQHYAVDKQKDLLNGNSFGENSADLGIRVGLKMGMINVVYANVNGEGYKKVTEDKQSGMANYGVVQINPIKPLYITGYVRHEFEEIENTPSTTVDKTVVYYGGGVAWKTDLLKAGVYVALGTRETDGSNENDAMIIDSYVNINLNSVTGSPILLMGNVAYGIDSGDALTDNFTALHIGFGVGYKFNDYCRTIVYYERTTEDDGTTETTDGAAYLKIEAKFK